MYIQTSVTCKYLDKTWLSKMDLFRPMAEVRSLLTAIIFSLGFHSLDFSNNSLDVLLFIVSLSTITIV